MTSGNAIDLTMSIGLCTIIAFLRWLFTPDSDQDDKGDVS